MHSAKKEKNSPLPWNVKIHVLALLVLHVGRHLEN
jgi:hypothetical protein